MDATREARTIGADFAPAAYSPDTSPASPVTIVTHRFYATDDGQLAHDMDGRRRATVPPEGWEAYAEQWPACAPVVAALQRPAQ